ncbi:MAG: hypothetical protein UY22_C0032G0016 [Candidatus Amesbacteria bacterium GW2011_GWC1_48_10]|uniref:Uncharacterized protein n=1 Tax=Candidatus Amesbacteria bacterium GW2011_GWC1_48_10 TaxID=1618365 RepID=A0A0G1UEP5_9BACT|nr:MAG: hypothetical protein UY22_C0032G0016 [Candidatus Amesbacteria bacterium GW2011_GWC1_48_10]
MRRGTIKLRQLTPQEEQVIVHKVEAGGDDGDLDRVDHGLVDGRAEDDVGIRVRVGRNHLRGL